MPALLQRVTAFASQHHLWKPRAVLLVAVSGGPDSLCLLHLLRLLAPAQNLSLQVAHLDHALRADSPDDARFVAELARAWSIPYVVDRREVAPFASQWGGLEAAARAMRYQFLREWALQIGASAVVTGHHADDQAETVVMRLLRGAGPTGLAGMRPSTPFEAWSGIGGADAPAPPGDVTFAPALVRPLLHISRDEIEAYCREHKLEPRRDSTNELPVHLRNRVRGHIIPALKAYNPNIVATLGRTARVCGDEDALLVELLDREWPSLARQAPDGVELDHATFTSLHPALGRRALRRGYSLVNPAVELSADHLDRMQALAARRRGRLQLPGGAWMRVSSQTIHIGLQAE